MNEREPKTGGRSDGKITPTLTDDGLHTCFCSPRLDSRTVAVILPSVFYANTVTLRFEEALSICLVDTRPRSPAVRSTRCDVSLRSFAFIHRRFNLILKSAFPILSAAYHVAQSLL